MTPPFLTPPVSKCEAVNSTVPGLWTFLGGLDKVVGLSQKRKTHCYNEQASILETGLPTASHSQARSTTAILEPQVPP